MKLRSTVLAAAAAAATVATALVGTPAQAQQAKEQFFPVLVYRTGAYAPNGVPWANGFIDYLTRAGASTASRSASRSARPATPPTVASSATNASRAKTAAPRCSSRCPPASPSR